jgi:polysaccharide export outer membrane protein
MQLNANSIMGVVLRAGLVIGCGLVVVSCVVCQHAFGAEKKPTSGDSTKAERRQSEADAPKQANAAVHQEYVIGEADILHINVWKEAELSQTVVVRPDGNISLPLINEIRASGLTPIELQRQLVDKFRKYVVDPEVAVTVVEIRSKSVYITGEVSKPGAYPIFTPTSVLQLIARAGGLTQFADRKRIFILRQEPQGQERYRFDYGDVIRGRNTEQDIILRSGDTVVVP